MTLEFFIENFHILAGAPNGVHKLREAILQLAVRGKLVPQDPQDEPAFVLLKKIKAEKEKLIKEGKLKKQKPPPPINPDDRPYEPPKGWEWVRLGEYCLLIMGQSPPSKFYNTEQIGPPFYQGKADFGKLYPKPTKWCKVPHKIAEKNDVLISVRAPVGPTNICPERSCIGRGLAALRSLSGANIFFTILALRAFEEKIAEQGFGSTFTAISRKHLSAFLFPAPPLPEQHRIVAKLDRLMALCDELEAKLKQTQSAAEKLMGAVVNELTKA